jgi:hypothetical protein
MKKNQKFKLTIVGAIALALTIGLNVRHALNNYGVMDNKLHVEVLAQSNGTDGSTTTISGDATGNGTGGISTSGGVVIVCFCTRNIIHKTCKVTGDNGRCAQSAPGGNVGCNEYNPNC